MTLREIGINLGFQLDDNGLKKAEKELEKVKEAAKNAEGWFNKLKARAAVIPKQLSVVGKKMSLFGEWLKKPIRPRVEVDKKSLSKAEAGIKSFSDMAKKLLAGFGVVIGIKKIVQAIKSIKGVSDVLDEVKKNFSKVLEKQLKSSGLLSTIQRTIRTVAGTATGLFKAIMPLITKVGAALADAIDFIMGMIDGFMAMRKKGSGGLASIEKMIKKIVNSIIVFATKLWGNIQKLTGSVKGFLKTLRGSGDPAATFEKVGDVVSLILDLIGQAVDGFTDFWSWVFDKGGNAETEGALSGINKVLDSVKNGLQWMKDHKDIMEAIGKAIGIVTAAWAAYKVVMLIVNGVTAAFNAIMAVNPITWIVIGVVALIAAIILLVKNWDKVKAAFGKAAAWFKGKVIDPIVNFFKGLGEKISGVFKKVVDWFKTNWQSILLFLINPFAGIIKYLYDNNAKFREFIDNIVQKVKDVWGAIKDWFKGQVIDPIANFFKGLWEGIEKGVEKVMGFLQKLNPKNWFKGKATLSADVVGDAPIPNAKGGVYGKETNIKVGEYSGAGSNPEIVSPRSMMADVVRGVNTGLVGEFINGLSAVMKTFLSDLATVQNMYRPQPALAMAGGGMTINQYNSWQQSFTCTDRDVQKKTDKAMESSTKDATSALARGIRNQR